MPQDASRLAALRAAAKRASDASEPLDKKRERLVRLMADVALDVLGAAARGGATVEESARALTAGKQALDAIAMLAPVAPVEQASGGVTIQVLERDDDPSPAQ